jgi:hypothetical protein
MKPTTDEQIIRLVSLWYEVICPLHHKDRDCHFHIERTWSYTPTGQYSPKWSFSHRGYLRESPDNQYDTIQEAMDSLRDYLVEAIVDQSESDEDCSRDNEWCAGRTMKRSVAEEIINTILR